MVSLKKLRVAGIAAALAALAACAGGETGEEMAEETAESGAEPAVAEAQEQTGGAMALPEGVTQEMVDQGREIFAGAGLCYACHGADGKGMPGLGANLSDAEWIHSDRSVDGIAQVVSKGVAGDQSTTGTPMLPKGGSGITDEQVRAVAAYVYTLSSGSS